MNKEFIIFFIFINVINSSKVFHEVNQCASQIEELGIYENIANVIDNLNNTNDVPLENNTQGDCLAPRININHFKNEVGLIKFIANQIQNLECRQQLIRYADSLEDSTLWAVSMYESTFKTPIGLISGNNYQFGHYDQCVRINMKDLRGKYCLAEAVFEPKYDTYPGFYRREFENAYNLEYDPYLSVWEKFIVPLDPSKKIRNQIFMGVCVPEECTYEDVKEGLNIILKQKLQQDGIDINVTVAEDSCSTNREIPYSSGAVVVRNILLFFLASVVVCTTWDMLRNHVEGERLNKMESLMESFSAYYNITKLIQPDNTSEMKVFHGMKTLSMVLIILGHRCASSYGGPFFNPEFLEERYRKFQDMLLLNGTLIVDTFFLIGGYLTCFFVCVEISKKNKVSIPLVYISRWLRMVPVYMLVVFFYGYLLEHMGDGPTWRQEVGLEAKRCRDNWWTNLFFVNNYINVDNMCIFQSWYVACDMHFTLIAPLIAIMLMKKPRKGMAVLSCILLAATLVPFLITYYYKYDGVLRLYVSLFEDIQKNEHFNQFYIKTHNRAFAYFLGMGAAYLHLYLKKINYRFSRLLKITFTSLAVVFAFGSIMGAWIFYLPGRRYDAMESALYCSLHRVAWALAMAWIPICGATNTFGILQPLLQRQSFVPLSKLCFSAFLVHNAVQLYTRAIVRTPEFMNFPKLFWMASGDFIYTFIIALIVHLVFEAPIGGLSRILLFPSPKKDRKPVEKAALNVQKEMSEEEKKDN